MGKQHPDLCSGLFQHVKIILEAYKNFPGLSWFFYDKSFRQKISIHQSLKWGMKDVDLWQNLLLPQKQLSQLYLLLDFFVNDYVFILMRVNVNGCSLCRASPRVNMPLLLLKIFFLKVVTPVKLENVLPWLHLYPVRKKVDMLINGFSYGFLLPSFFWYRLRSF